MKTVAFLESVPIYYLHVFPFSARSGTRAAEMKDRVTEPEKRGAGVRRLRILDQHKREAFYRRFIGKEMRIIPKGKVYRRKIHAGLYG